MSKKILVLAGSARKNGNSNRMARAFADAAAENGNEVKVVDTAIRPENPVLLMMTSIPLQMIFWQQTLLSSPARYTGILYLLR